MTAPHGAAGMPCAACERDREGRLEHTCDPPTIPAPPPGPEMDEAEALCRASEEAYERACPGMTDRVAWKHMRPLDHTIWLAVARKARELAAACTPIASPPGVLSPEEVADVAARVADRRESWIVVDTGIMRRLLASHAALLAHLSALSREHDAAVDALTAERDHYRVGLANAIERAKTAELLVGQLRVSEAMHRQRAERLEDERRRRG